MVRARFEAAEGEGEPEQPLGYDDILSSVPRAGLRRFPSLLASAFRIVNRAAPRNLRGAMVLQLTNGLIVAGQLLAVRTLLARMLGGGEVTFAELRGPLAALVAMYALTSWSSILLAEQQRLIQELVARHTTDQLLEAATAVELIELERPGFHDRLLRAQINSQARPVQMVNGATGMVSALFSVVGVAVALLIVQPVFVVVLLFGFAPAWIATRITSRSSYRFTAAQARRDRIRSYLSVLMLGRTDAKEVRAYDLAPPLRRRFDVLFDQRLADVRELVRDRTRVGLIGSAATAILGGATVGTLAWYATSGRTDLADAGAAVAGMLVLVQRLQALQGNISSVYESALFIEDFTGFVDELAQQRSEQPDQPAPADPHTIVAEGVTFRYPNGNVLALDDVSMRMARGEVVALVGENGSGKTTMAKILAGLLRPTEGTLTWDGVDLAACDSGTIRDRVAVLFQDFGRFQLTFGDNIELGRWTAADDTERRSRAASRAGLDRLVEQLRDGFDTPLGPEFLGGTDLSSGQWQRLALARATFRDAPIVILDEPTASLDPKAESELFERIRDLYAGTAVLLISHRFASVRSADRIYVLDNGRIVEEGRHDELMALGGVYADLFTRQAAGYLESGPPAP